MSMSVRRSAGWSDAWGIETERERSIAGYEEHASAPRLGEQESQRERDGDSSDERGRAGERLRLKVDGTVQIKPAGFVTFCATPWLHHPSPLQQL